MTITAIGHITLDGLVRAPARADVVVARYRPAGP